jgi:hypothetical protein
MNLRRLLACLLLLLAIATFSVSSIPSPLHHSDLLRRQTATSINGTVQGGSESAQHAAEAAGNSIGTGSGGDRSSPKSQEGFAKLLSGVFFGALLTLLFGGAFIVQAWHYFERFGRRGSDRLSIQVAVAMMVVFSLVQDCAVIHRIWDIHVNNFGDFAFPLLTGEYGVLPKSSAFSLSFSKSAGRSAFLGSVSRSTQVLLKCIMSIVSGWHSTR